MRYLNQFKWYRKWRGGMWYLLGTYSKSCVNSSEIECLIYYWSRGNWKENLNQFKSRFIMDSIKSEDYTTMCIINPDPDILNMAETDDRYTIINNDEGQIEIKW